MKRLNILWLAFLLVACAAPAVTPTVSDPAEPLPTEPANTPTPVPTNAPTAEPTPTPPPVTPLPAGTLIEYNKEGGYAFTSITLTVHSDGTAHLEGSEIALPIDWTVPADQFKALQAILADPAFATLAYDPQPGVNCADCYVMTVRALSQQKTVSLKYDQADLELTPNLSPLYDQLVLVMKNIEDSAPQAGALPTDSLQTTPKPGSNSLPADVLLTYNRAGGIAYSDNTLVIHRDGVLDLTINTTPQPVSRSLNAGELAALTALLNDPSLSTLQSGKPSLCNDCYVYTVVARTANGIITLRADDAQLSNNGFPAYQQLLAFLALYFQ